MGKKRFITVRDVDELLSQGQSELALDVETVVTDAGRERALERGLRLVKSGDGASTSKGGSSAGVAAAPSQAPATTGAPTEVNKAELGEIVKKSVVAYLGRSPENIDAVISKVLARF